jgi:hypothetical protein
MPATVLWPLTPGTIPDYRRRPTEFDGYAAGKTGDASLPAIRSIVTELDHSPAADGQRDIVSLRLAANPPQP